MKLWHSVIIGIAIIIGFVLHAAIKTIPECIKLRNGKEMQVRMMEMSPKEIKLGETSVLYLPRISYMDTSIDVNYEFYSFVGGTLKRVKLTGE